MLEVLESFKRGVGHISQVHSKARTMPRTRVEIKASPGTLEQLAQRYNVAPEEVQDPPRMHALRVIANVQFPQFDIQSNTFSESF